ncbi:MAG TPA: dihydrolipoamide acetyltransferase family protein, partial [Egibacteraceae bacterium]|nr:dihydrolipoamide acetyltransferase family protein [Egibacteraceae bacterium]
MPFEFHLPDIGEGIAEAEIVRWLVAEGDEVTEDQPMAEIETDKAVVEMPAPVTGTVLRLGAEEGSMLRVGDLMVVVEDGSSTAESAPAPADAAAAPAPGTAETAAAPAAPSEPGQAPAPTAEQPAARRPRAAPATRRLARELGVDLAAVSGSGPGGRITDEDVAAAADGHRPDAEAPARRAVQARPPSAPGEDEERIPLRGLRRRTAETMANAWRDIPHTVGFHEVDAQELLQARRSLKDRAEQAGAPLTLTALLVKASALALVEHPMVNSSFDVAEQQIILKHRRNIGVAVETGEGLVLPGVRDADQLSLLGIARELARLTAA